MIYIQSIHRSINQTIELLDSITDNTKFDRVRDSLFDNVVAVIHFAGDIYPRIKKYDEWNTWSEEKEFFLAFVYLNNQIKHDLSLGLFYYEVCGSSYPMRFPYRYGPPGVVWADFQDHGKSREAKREYYDQHLKLKDVKKSLIKLDELLKNVESQKAHND